MPGSSTTPSQTGARDDVPIYVAFRENEHVGTREFQVYAAQWLAYALPYRRFAVTLAGASARLGADVDRCSFTVVDLHHLLLAGLCRRTEILDIPRVSGNPISRFGKRFVRVPGDSGYMSDYFQKEIALLCIESALLSRVRPRTTAMPSVFIRTLKWNLLWLKQFETIDEQRQGTAGVPRHI
jgi:hypothetical protein